VALENFLSLGKVAELLGAPILSQPASKFRSGAGMSPVHKLRAGLVSVDANVILDLHLAGNIALLVELFAGRTLVSDFVMNELTKAVIELPEAEVVGLTTDDEWKFFEDLRLLHPQLGTGELGAITVARIR